MEEGLTSDPSPVEDGDGELELVDEGEVVLPEDELLVNTGVIATSMVVENRNIDPSSDMRLAEVVAAPPIPKGADSAQYVVSAFEPPWATVFRSSAFTFMCMLKADTYVVVALLGIVMFTVPLKRSNGAVRRRISTSRLVV
ncbi:hypothetical protein C8J57DRAFT_1720812 [Mycena rebaudengoi]|nr:hypothetical protein C8J57DRAFT_1720812 [Mycena rebaudengoi]